MKPGDDPRIRELWRQVNDQRDAGTFAREDWLKLLHDVARLVTDENEEELGPVYQLALSLGFVESHEELDAIVDEALRA